jgi:hypothetical protein
MEDVGKLYGHLVYFTAIWYILWPLGTFHGYLIHFFRFGMLYQEKSGNPTCVSLFCKFKTFALK